MADTPDPTDFMFPKLDDVQIARLAPFGREDETQAGEVVVEQGDAHRGVFVVLSGSLELLAVSAAGRIAPANPEPWGI